MEIPFVETYDEAVKKTIEKTFLNHGVSYLIKVDKVRDVKKGHFESRTKYSFRINRFQKEEARAAIEEKAIDGKNIIFIQ
jgi:hypothetical protein